MQNMQARHHTKICEIDKPNLPTKANLPNLDTIAVSLFVYDLLEFDKYSKTTRSKYLFRYWGEMPCLGWYIKYRIQWRLYLEIWMPLCGKWKNGIISSQTDSITQSCLCVGDWLSPFKMKRLGGDVVKFLTKFLFQIFSNHNFIDGHLLCDFGLKRWDL